jgi:uncharacterized protein (TIGR03435 family)
MISPAFWNETWTNAVWTKGVWTAALVNHLWQSTIVALVAWLLTLALRSNQARTRYWVWMIASVKFLIPFSLLIAAGESLRTTIAAPAHRPALAAVVEQITQPFPQTAAVTAEHLGNAHLVSEHNANLLPVILFSLWLCGFLHIVFSWARGWWTIRAAVRASSAMQIKLPANVPVHGSPRMLEPGVFGIVRPVLLLPENINDRLSASQLSAIIDHELWHIRRRDNLTAAIHMFVEAAFWFHPAVWWIGARLLEERERACDEAVLQSGNEARLYAESILDVCKFYVGSPLACMSGITGSDLKRRIVRIMTKQIACKLDFSRKLLLTVAAVAAIAAPVFLGLVHVTQVRAQSTSENPATNIADTWQGTLHAGQDLRTVVKISKADGGGYKAVFYSIDQGGAPLPVAKITLEGTTVKMSLTAIGGSYEGKLSADGKSITGNWSQGPNPLPLTLTRATPETEWAIPAPPPKLPPMDANASPSFEVATIKPTKPDEQRKAFLVRGRRFQTINVSLNEIISFAYGVHAKQVVGAPSWADTEKFDIDAQPDGEGAPSDKQWKGMLQKLIVERFKLSFHRDKKELSVYVLSLAKTGQKLNKSEGDPNGLPGLFFQGLGDLRVTNANTADFAGLLQQAVLDRPVLDQTGLNGRFDFTLKWTPDDSQFGGIGANIPPPTDSATAPPGLYTAIQEQIGLKLDATKAPAEVLVIDHVEKPSEN